MPSWSPRIFPSPGKLETAAYTLRMGGGEVKRRKGTVGKRLEPGAQRCHPKEKFHSLDIKVLRTGKV